MAARQPDQVLDLCGTPCPLNFIRCRLALATLSAGQCLQVDLDPGEPEEMVVPGLRRDGHGVMVEHLGPDRVRLLVICSGE